MSKLLKSKILLGVAVFALAVAVGFTASAADGVITKTLKKGMKDVQVKYLQQTLNEKGYAVSASGAGSVGSETTYFGPATVSAVKKFQAAMGLVADGVFGAKSRASLGGSAPVTSSDCPAGALFNPTTGAACTSTPVTTNPTGPVAVVLASDNPSAGYIINNQATADLLHVTFTGVGTVNSITLHRNGISNQNTLANVYLYDGMTRLTDGYSFNNTGDLTMNSLGLVVNGTKTVSVKADVSSTASTDSSTIAVSLTGYSAGTATTANLVGNMMTIGSGSPASVYIDGTTNGVASASVNAGSSSYTVWSDTAQVNTRAVYLKGANFRVTGSAPSDALANIKLFIDGVDAGKVATLGTINGTTYAMFDFSAAPLNLTTGSHTVDVRADVVKGSSYNVVVSLQQPADLAVYDPQVGVNIAILKAASTSYVASTAGTISISSGSASVVIDPSFQSMTNITGGATNTIIGKFKVHGYGEDVKVSSLAVLPTLTSMTPSAAGLSNLAVYFNGSQVGSSYNWTSGTQTFQLGSQMILPAGVDSYIEVRADLQTTGSVNYTAGTVQAQLSTATGNAQGQTSKASVNFPTASINTTGLTVQTGVLAVSKNAGYANQNVNPNTEGVKIGSYVLQNQSTSEKVRVTSLVVALTNDGSTALTTSTTPALTNFSNLKTSETSGSGATPIQPAASNTFSVNFELAPGATKTIDVLADTSAATSGSVVTTLVVTSLGASSNVSISQNGNATAVTGQTLTLAVGTVTNPPTLLSTTSTAAQYVPAANGGAANVVKATFNIASTGGSATISEMKLTVNSQDASTASTDADANSTGSQTLTVTSSTGMAVGDTVQLVAATTNGYGIITTVTNATTLVVDVKVASTGTPSLVRLVPNTVTSVKIGTVEAPVVSGVAYLTGLSLVVPNGGSGLNQDVYVSYSEVGTNGIISGATSKIALEYMKYSAGGTTKTLCTTAMATCTATISTAVAAPTMKLVGSTLTFTASKPTATVAVGNIEVIDVAVTANAKGNAVLNTLKITVTPNAATTGTSADTIIVKDSNNQTVTTTSTAFGTNAGGATTITFTGGYTISGSQTFKIYAPIATVTGTGVNGASLSTTLSTGSAAMTWTDSAGNASVAESGSTAGTYPTALIPSYPSTFSSIIYN